MRWRQVRLRVFSLEPQINVLVNYTNSVIGPTPFTADDGTTQTIGSLNQADFIPCLPGSPGVG